MYNVGNTKWTRASVMSAVHKLPFKMQSYAKKENRALHAAGIRLFGSWQALMEACDIDYENEKKIYYEYQLSKLKAKE